MARILMVDDDPIALKQMRRILGKEGHQVRGYTSPLKGLNSLKTQGCDLLVTDLRMAEMDGLELLQAAKRECPLLEVILVTGYPSLDGAVEAVKSGAYHYLAKPFSPDQLRSTVEQALAVRELKAGWDGAAGPAGEPLPAPLLLGKCPKMALVDTLIRQIAPTECNVLITGESGTGKEVVAKSIHARSARRSGPFVALNCGGLNPELVANELFGHEKDAFTGARSRKIGLIETANGGTLFLDEIGEMAESMQVKLLRVLQERELFRVGGTQAVPVDLRIIAATARDLTAAVVQGAFRQDLYYRINVVNIKLPPLRERREDIGLLTYHMLGKANARTAKRIENISAAALKLLQEYSFPGNVRELENILERAAALCSGNTIQVAHLPPDLATLQLLPLGSGNPQPLLKLDELEEEYIRHVLQLTGGMRAEAAQMLGIDRSSLWRKMKKYGIE
ncbi:MAG: Fis family transcriptional regulator [Syntrophobacteraceae bacterium CG2_30_61_12]|nr:MAG: Fis family transcriptional regulator [Syntrophobacteraceae bacterium CG2_30_61_12]